MVKPKWRFSDFAKALEAPSSLCASIASIIAVIVAVIALFVAVRQTRIAEIGAEPDFDCSFDFQQDGSKITSEQLTISNVGFRAKSIRCDCYTYVQWTHWKGLRDIHTFRYPVSYFSFTQIKGTKIGAITCFRGFGNRREEQRLVEEANDYSGTHHEGQFALFVKHFVEVNYTDVDDINHTKYFTCDSVDGITDANEVEVRAWKSEAKSHQIPSISEVKFANLLDHERQMSGQER